MQDIFVNNSVFFAIFYGYIVKIVSSFVSCSIFPMCYLFLCIQQFFSFFIFTRQDLPFILQQFLYKTIFSIILSIKSYIFIKMLPYLRKIRHFIDLFEFTGYTIKIIPGSKGRKSDPSLLARGLLSLEPAKT